MRVKATVDHDPELAKLRLERNALLAASDAIVSVPDYPISAQDKQAVLAWRASLRSAFEGKLHSSQVQLPTCPVTLPGRLTRT